MRYLYCLTQNFNKHPNYLAMRRFCIFVLSVCLVAVEALAQNYTVQFRGTDSKGDTYKLDSIEVTDITQGWSMMLVSPDTVLHLTTSEVDRIALAGSGDAVIGKAYPNPAEEAVLCDISVIHNTTAKIRLYGSDGVLRAEKEMSLRMGTNTIEARAERSGIYWMLVEADGHSSTVKFAITKGCGRNGINLTGNFSAAKGENSGSFMTGDAMRFTGYATYQGNVVASTPREESVTGDCEIVLALPIAYDYPTVTLSGRFSVGEGRQVSFSQGNLQYSTTGNHQTADGTAATGTWRFAATQYEYIGEGNAQIGEDYGGYIDLFGWGTSGWNSGAPAYEPYSVSETNTNYAPCGSAEMSLTGAAAKADWGVYNAISNGGNMPMQWRTLTSEEWQYLTDESNASRTGKTAEVTITVGETDYNGLLLLPDAFELPAGCDYTAGFGNGYQTNLYDAEQWAAMEEAGAVFLTTAGRRNGTTMTHVNARGIYWSSSRMDESNAYTLFFVTGVMQSDAAEARRIGAAVRLVRDAE